MSFVPSAWQRLSAAQLAIYVRPEDGDWFVPTTQGDALLSGLLAGGPTPAAVAARRFLARLPAGTAGAYPGRAALLRPDNLRELWLHLTDRCNQACTHCLFSCSPGAGRELPTQVALQRMREAGALGCRVFVLTGGEPLLHPGFVELVGAALGSDGARVVVLSNGLLAGRHAEALTAWPADRVHFQLALEGTEATHDGVRGAGSYQRLLAGLRSLREVGFPFTLAAAVGAHNVSELCDLVRLAHSHGATGLHLLWHHFVGRSASDVAVPTARLAESVRRAGSLAAALELSLDNLDALRGQVFSPRGTRFDGSNAAWEAAAVGPDGALYPSAATVGRPALATEVVGGLAETFRTSPVLQRLRQRSVRDSQRPLRFLTGGGDPDQRLDAEGSWSRQDPYLPLHEELALWLIEREALPWPDGGLGLRLQRGDVLQACPGASTVALTHSNCMLSVAQRDRRAPVRELYAAAVANPREDIANPVCLPAELVEHIPAQSRFRSYGCGSPVVDAALRPGEAVLDLGSGTGVECFVAARAVGSGGSVIGVDMLEPMLRVARSGIEGVAERLGYSNVEFRRGYLEALPVDDASVDVVMSNCVLNLSVDKRRTFAEIARVLRPGGRLVVSDVVCDTEPGPAIRNDENLKGECIAGALTGRSLFGLLADSGLVGARALKRFPYRVVRGHPFHSLTFVATRPGPGHAVRVMYRGPHQALILRSGELLFPGIVTTVPADQVDPEDTSVYVLGSAGEVYNVDQGEAACGCSPPDTEPEASCCGPAPGQGGPAPGPSRCCTPAAEPAEPEGCGDGAAGCCAATPAGSRWGAEAPTGAHEAGCLLCGGELLYGQRPRLLECARCGDARSTSVACAAGHYVCDGCHAAEGIRALRTLCATTRETDLITLLELARALPAVAVHGPEHHALVPAVIVTASRNLGGPLGAAQLELALQRGATIPGGFCGHAGACGAAFGVGIGFGVVLGSTPLNAATRSTLLRVTAEVSLELAQHAGARCCQRDCWLALRKAAELSRTLLPLALTAEGPLVCHQQRANRACTGRSCPLFPDRTAPPDKQR